MECCSRMFLWGLYNRLVGWKRMCAVTNLQTGTGKNKSPFCTEYKKPLVFIRKSMLHGFFCWVPVKTSLSLSLFASQLFLSWCLRGETLKLLRMCIIFVIVCVVVCAALLDWADQGRWATQWSKAGKNTTAQNMFIILQRNYMMDLSWSAVIKRHNFNVYQKKHQAQTLHQKPWKVSNLVLESVQVRCLYKNESNYWVTIFLKGFLSPSVVRNN